VAKDSAEPFPTIDRSTSRLVLGAAIGQFVSKTLVIPLSLVVLGVRLHRVRDVSLSDRKA